MERIYLLNILKGAILQVPEELIVWVPRGMPQERAEFHALAQRRFAQCSVGKGWRSQLGEEYHYLPAAEAFCEAWFCLDAQHVCLRAGDTVLQENWKEPETFLFTTCKYKILLFAARRLAAAAFLFFQCPY